MLGRKNAKRNRSDAEDLRDALGELGRQHQRQARSQRRKKGRFAWLSAAPDWLKLLLKLAVLVMLVLIGDGVRRENKELSATLVAFTGQVTVQKGGEGTDQAASADMRLRDKDVVSTAAGSVATIVFPDGSAIELEPGTQFVVRLLDFARGQTRDRSFMVNFGGLAARVSTWFGANPNSQATICTPTAVAAVRGTGFRVTYDRATKQTLLQVTDGRVEFRTTTAATYAVPGQSVSAAGYQMETPGRLSGGDTQILGGRIYRMSGYEKPMGGLQRVEWAITTFMDPVLQILGVAPGCWSYSSIDFARRTACMEALRRLRTHIAEATDKAPDVLNPVTLAELSLDPKEQDRILSAFSGMMLVSYQKMRGDRYAIYARARDKRRTLYLLTEASLGEVKQQQTP